MQQQQQQQGALGGELSITPFAAAAATSTTRVLETRPRTISLITPDQTVMGKESMLCEALNLMLCFGLFGVVLICFGLSLHPLSLVIQIVLMLAKSLALNTSAITERVFFLVFLSLNTMVSVCLLSYLFHVLHAKIMGGIRCHDSRRSTVAQAEFSLFRTVCA